MRSFRSCLVTGLVLLALVLPSSRSFAEIYRWVDAAGKIHFTHDLGQVPPAHRAAAMEKPAASGSDSKVQRFTPPPPARSAPQGGLRATTAGVQGRVHEVPVARAGSSLAVMVRLNDRVDVMMLVDTGATDVSIPMWAAQELGLAVEGQGVRFNAYSTANGVVKSAVVNLDSVQLGSARAENVSGSVSSSMQKGLLGLSFLNHFDMRVDPSRGVITLTENQLEETGLLRGGRSEMQWRTEFESLRRRIESADEMLEEIPFSRTRKRARVEQTVATLRRHLEVLESEADDARVPFSWR